MFLQLLPRSSTGERMNPYNTLWTGPTPGDGPQEMHVVLIDNGRTKVLSDSFGREALRCIRCSACLNVCPVYEKVGGHAYGSVYPGPIGAVLTPQLRGVSTPVDRSLPYASTLCGACNDVCPVRIPLAELLVHMRHKVVESKKADRLAGANPSTHLPGFLARLHQPHVESVLMASTSWAMSDGKRWAAATKAASSGGKVLGLKFGHLGPLPWPLSKWTDARDVPIPPTESFRAWWARERGDAGSRRGSEGRS
mgnify:CR=1 FL=1